MTNLKLTLNSVQTRTEGMFDTKGAADFLQLSWHTLNDWRSKGRGPRFVKLGGAVRYRRQDLEDWLDSRVYCNTTEAKMEA